ncbi:uncharacterized protein LOC141501974 isoform X2 [Macrotis lagotis]|uniref:uncharacterized protein LOC141501974 isoform X2 n=1 Tax=Macrotis lagotis TaxID=92651 RepID=UPI003D690C3F
MTARPKRIKFSEEEKLVILEEFSLRKDVLVPKTGRYRNTADRQRAWAEIAAAVNALNPLVQRSPEEVRKKWKNMILDARKELASARPPLLRRRPQERLFHHISALLERPGPDAPEPGLRARGPPSPAPACCKAQGFLPPAPSPRKPDPWADGPAAKSLLPPADGPGLPAGGPEPLLPCEPGLCASPGPDPTLTYKIKCPVSPLLDWPCLGVSSSPGTPGAEGMPAAVDDNVSASVVTAEEDLLPGPRPIAEELPEKDPGELAKQSRLQTEILELQKETLQLQKEKILLEKEKLVLEIVKLRRELGT